MCSHGPTPFQLAGRSYHYTIPGKVMMFTGAMVSVSGMVAVIEARSLSRIAINSLIQSLCAALVLESVAGSSAFALSYSIDEGFFNASLSEDLETDYSRCPGVKLYIDLLQKKLSCCGVRGPEDWSRSDWRSENLFNVTQPSSCCRRRYYCDKDEIFTMGCGAVSSGLLHGCLVRLYTCAFACILVHTSSYLALVFLQGKV